MTTQHLNQTQLAARWGISPRTLERWRCQGQGPRYLKLGGRVIYRVEDVEAFEALRAQPGGIPDLEGLPPAHGVGAALAAGHPAGGLR
ncbi:MAG: helix-turn-helix domain-containing protein [Azospirillum sp.]|nr:helix-turn-helix domain-containing protein [Azospirillum sp.]